MQTTMATDPPSPLFDPTAAAFHILSERIHDLEENVTLLLNNAKWQDMSRNRPYLNNTLYGYRFPISVEFDTNSLPYLTKSEITIRPKKDVIELFDPLEHLQQRELLIEENLGEAIHHRYKAEMEMEKDGPELDDIVTEGLCENYLDLLQHTQYHYVYLEAQHRALKQHVDPNKFETLSEVDYNPIYALSFQLHAVPGKRVTIEDFLHQAVRLWKTILPVHCIESLFLDNPT